jgi:hypothetical protein
MCDEKGESKECKRDRQASYKSFGGQFSLEAEALAAASVIRISESQSVPRWQDSYSEGD